MFDFPEPLGPTTTATPGSRRTSTGSGNDLKPRILTARRYRPRSLTIADGRPVPVSARTRRARELAPPLGHLGRSRSSSIRRKNAARARPRPAPARSPEATGGGGAAFRQALLDVRSLQLQAADALEVEPDAALGAHDAQEHGVAARTADDRAGRLRVDGERADLPTAPHEPHVERATVSSPTNTSPSRPPIALPSSLRSALSMLRARSGRTARCGHGSGRSLGRPGRPRPPRRSASGRRRTRSRPGVRPPKTSASISRVDAPRVALPAVRLLPGERVHDRELRIGGREAVELLPVDDVLERPRRVEQRRREVEARRCPVPKHRHQRARCRSRPRRSWSGPPTVPSQTK